MVLKSKDGGIFYPLKFKIVLDTGYTSLYNYLGQESETRICQPERVTNRETERVAGTETGAARESFGPKGLHFWRVKL